MRKNMFVDVSSIWSVKLPSRLGNPGLDQCSTFNVMWGGYPPLGIVLRE